MTLYPSNFSVKNFCSRGFTLLELLAVISVISILVSISVPSFLNYINFLRLRAFRNNVISDINYLISVSQKYGGNCTIQFNELRVSSRSTDRFAATLKCFQDSTQLLIDNSSSKYLHLPSNQMFFLTNTSSLQIGNHGAIVGPKDHLFVFDFHPSFGSSSTPICLMLKRYNTSFKTGTYSRNVANTAGSFISRIVPSVSPSYCS